MTDLSKNKAVTEQAPAKINLYLHVTGKRTDGYHLLDSLMVFAGIGDTVVCRPSPDDDFKLLLDGPFGERLQADDDNLVMRAARDLKALCGADLGAHITLTKRLPVSSGIGGGSADAAATLRALCRLWAVTPEPEALHNLALSLGADVPVCLHGRAAFVSGIGENLAFVPSLPPLWLVLINPGVGVSTPAVFKARTDGFRAAASFDPTGMSVGAFVTAIADRHNDLYRPALGLQPVIGEAMDCLDHLKEASITRMSGSGATCFATFPSREQAFDAAERLKKARPDWWTVAAPMLGSISSYHPGTTGLA